MCAPSPAALVCPREPASLSTLLLFGDRSKFSAEQKLGQSPWLGEAQGLAHQLGAAEGTHAPTAAQTHDKTCLRIISAREPLITRLGLAGAQVAGLT